MKRTADERTAENRTRWSERQRKHQLDVTCQELAANRQQTIQEKIPCFAVKTKGGHYVKHEAPLLLYRTDKSADKLLSMIY